MCIPLRTADIESCTGCLESWDGLAQLRGLESLTYYHWTESVLDNVPIPPRVSALTALTRLIITYWVGYEDHQEPDPHCLTRAVAPLTRLRKLVVSACGDSECLDLDRVSFRVSDIPDSFTITNMLKLYC
jgi:hypothetical protein